MLERKLVKNMPPRKWMRLPETESLMKALNTKDKQTMFVGGCVRNAILNDPVSDIDLATQFLPEEASAELQRSGFKVINTGGDHGTITAVLNGLSYEITTLRKDVKTNGRHAEVAFTDNWVLDAERRDFSMNTLLADIDGNVYDPLEHGLSDLEARKVVFVGDPAKRIQEDYLRILRFFRFQAVYGDGAMDEKAFEACKAHAEGLEDISKERVTMEFIKILGAKNPAYVLKKMMDAKILIHLFHTKCDMMDLTAYSKLEEGVLEHDGMGRLAFISHYEEDHLNTIHDHLILSNKQKKDVMAAIRAYHEIEWEETKIKKVIYKYGRKVCIRAALSHSVLKGTNLDEFKDLIYEYEPPMFPMNGDDVKIYTKAEGEKIGEILDRTELWWLDNGMIGTRDECIGFMDQTFNS